MSGTIGHFWAVHGDGEDTEIDAFNTLDDALDYAHVQITGGRRKRVRVLELKADLQGEWQVKDTLPKVPVTRGGGE